MAPIHEVKKGEHHGIEQAEEFGCIGVFERRFCVPSEIQFFVQKLIRNELRRKRSRQRIRGLHRGVVVEGSLAKAK